MGEACCLQRSSEVRNEWVEAYLYIICLLLLKIKKDNTMNNCVKNLYFTSVALSAVLSSNRDWQDLKSLKSSNRFNEQFKNVPKQSVYRVSCDNDIKQKNKLLLEDFSPSVWHGICVSHMILCCRANKL